ncbi:MAG: glycosyltransferase family 2 protein [Pseudomonadales bacterium]|nr:glycosyltransferase family 2 protein [Pseudomonadales bacterium]
MAPYKLCAIVPVYNHGATVAAVAHDLRARGIDVMLVDDGSSEDCARVLDALAQEPGIQLVRRAVNGGKGAAVLDGLRAAYRQGYSHALQIDADGQHDRGDIERFIAVSRDNPQALVCGAPVYGADAPKARLYGRWLTRVWVWINTLSFNIYDAMCGFRIYPLPATVAVIDAERIGQRMDFDISIIVHLHWRGVPMLWLPTRVIYPQGGVSHFNVLRDNLLISRAHALLFFGMLWRAPRLLARRLRGAA